MRHHWHLDMEAREGTLAVEETRWPFSPQSLDAVVLHHGLDFSLSPRLLLREASQAVRAGGHLVVFGFNPLSSWAAPHYLGQSWLGQAGFVRPGRQMFGALPQRQRSRAFPTLTLPPMAAGTRRTHKRDRQ